ncbi:MAG: hypothetical protein O9293_07980 [Porphyrobacter sp.]|nr:hypothetical protein [Porphyrobacter sp.]
MFHAKHDSGGGLEWVWKGSKARQTRAKAHFARASGVLALAILAACSSPEELAAKTGAAPPEAPAAPAPPPAPATDKVEFTDYAEQGVAKRTFGYSWLAAVAALPPLASHLMAERDAMLAEQKADWQSALAEVGDKDCVSCVNRDIEKTWDVVANLPRFLSLSASWYDYSGGAHGNFAFDTLVWDRQTQRAIDPKTMFRSPAALQAALGEAWCKRLGAERQNKLGEEYSDDGFFGCPPIADLTVLVGSSDRKHFNRIGLIAAPYVAGSYAEGEYEVTLPVTPKVLAAVKPEFKAAFALGK